MNPPSLDIAKLLENAALGLALQSNLFVSRFPESPQEVVAIYDSPSTAPDLHGYRYNGVNAQVRSIRYLDGWKLANDIGLYLHTDYGHVFENVYYTGIWMSTDVEPIGQDENERNLFSINFEIQRR
mgnify:CR=1 FL=1